MLDRMTDAIDFHGKALQLRAQRQEVLSSNIANADTPGFKARDFDFAAALKSATAGAAMPGRPADIDHAARLQYTAPEQASLDGNSVDLNRERAAFADNSLRYEATLRFINGRVRTMMTAIRGE